jgi:hypothetical protein
VWTKSELAIGRELDRWAGDVDHLSVCLVSGGLGNLMKESIFVHRSYIATEEYRVVA